TATGEIRLYTLLFLVRVSFFFFFFQAEDGIRDWSVTGVQTCALPICLGSDATSAASCLVCCSTASAARRYERIRNGPAASISSRAAVSSSSLAISMFSIGPGSPGLHGPHGAGEIPAPYATPASTRAWPAQSPAPVYSRTVVTLSRSLGRAGPMPARRVSQPDDLICLRSFASLDDVEFD